MEGTRREHWRRSRGAAYGCCDHPERAQTGIQLRRRRRPPRPNSGGSIGLGDGFRSSAISGARGLVALGPSCALSSAVFGRLCKELFVEAELTSADRGLGGAREEPAAQRGSACGRTAKRSGRDDARSLAPDIVPGGASSSAAASSSSTPHPPPLSNQQSEPDASGRCGLYSWRWRGPRSSRTPVAVGGATSAVGRA